MSGISGKISQDVTVPYKAGIFVPGVDMSLPVGSQNVKLLASEFVAPGVNVMSYGAVGDGVTDDTAAIQAAIATGKRVYLPQPLVSYYIKNAINCTTPGQIIQGDGKGMTIVKVDSNFNLGALGVFVCPGGPWVPGPQFRDFQINFTQPDTASAGSLIAYPVAFYAQGVARTTWHGIKINAAMMGIDLRANGGGSTIMHCELCCFNWHINIDGAADSITVQSTRFENDLLTTNQSTVYHAQAIGIVSGRCDDLHVFGCLFFCFLGLSLVISSDGTSVTNGNVTNCDFDTYSGINMTNGNIGVSGCMFTLGSAGSIGVEMSGGNLSASSCWFLANVALSNGMVLVSGALSLQIANSRFDFSVDCLGVDVFGTALVNIVGCRFNAVSAARTNPMINVVANGLLTLGSCRFSAKGAGSGQALNIGWDAAHNVCGNSFGGWATSLATGGLHVFANNN